MSLMECQCFFSIFHLKSSNCVRFCGGKISSWALLYSQLPWYLGVYPSSRAPPHSKMCSGVPDDALNCEVLIGSNFYCHFMSGQCRRVERGPIALESCLGWILSGPVYDCPASASTEVNLTDTHVLTLASNERGEERVLEQQVANSWNLESRRNRIYKWKIPGRVAMETRSPCSTR